jgi:hypothetical protein
MTDTPRPSPASGTLGTRRETRWTKTAHGEATRLAWHIPELPHSVHKPSSTCFYHPSAHVCGPHAIYTLYDNEIACCPAHLNV